MAHAFAPGATLDIILVPAGAISSPADFASAITKAIRDERGAGTGPRPARHRPRLLWRRRRDRQSQGPPVQVNMSASGPLVLGVGGTILGADPDGAMAIEYGDGELRAATGTSSCTRCGRA